MISTEMKKKPTKTKPAAALQSSEEKFSWLRDIKSMSIAELVEIYAYAEAIIETVRDPLIVLDKKLTVKTVNKAFLEFFQANRGKVLGKSIFEINAGAWNIPELKKLLGDVLPRNAYFNDYEVRHNFEKLGQKIMLLDARRIELEKNKTQLVLLAIEDITELKEQEKQKDEFVSLVSHELKNPLTSIKAYNHILQKKLTDHEDASVKSTLASIETKIGNISDLISDLLSEAKTRAKGFRYHDKEFDVMSLVEEIIENASRRADSHSIILQKKVKKTIRADRARIGQVLDNLLSNAITYSADTKNIRVNVSVTKGILKVSVQDFGVGISKDNIKKVFMPFFRETEMQKETFPSIGLGLYISSEIVKHYGGRIGVKSTKGKGSTFHFTLPVKK